MLENCKSARERWGGVSDIIDRWLKERQDLLVLFCNLSQQKPENFDEETETTLRRFCEIVVDYVSAGHFEIYDHLAQEGKEYGDETALTKAKQHYQEVDATTEQILDFNDKYQETDDLSSLVSDLSQLGESLASRFEAEDMMISLLHNSHKDKVS